MITFEYTDDENDTTVTIKTEAVLLDRIVEIFERFLRAMGFSFDGNLDFLEDMNDAYIRGYEDGLVECDESMTTGKRYRVKSVEEMEKILGVRKGEPACGDAWGWTKGMWDTCGEEVKPDVFDCYRYALKGHFFYLPEWVEEIPE